MPQRKSRAAEPPADEPPAETVLADTVSPPITREVNVITDRLVMQNPVSGPITSMGSPPFSSWSVSVDPQVTVMPDPAQERPPEPKLNVSLLIDTSNTLDESRLDLRMTVSEIRDYLEGRKLFIPLPKRYAKFLGVHDSGEAVFQAVSSVHQFRIKDWPEPMPDE
jgi:hypothetical protein